MKLRTRVTKGAGSKAAALAMAYKLLDAAQKRWDNSAEVTVVLWEKWVSDGHWHAMAEATWAVMPGGGSVARVTAKANCRANSVRIWHSNVLVDIPDANSFDEKVTADRPVPCVA